MKLLRIIALPISFLYGCIAFLRNKFYDWGIFSSTKFDIPTISVGNLSIGGTGKSPHIEYLIRLLKPELYIATLSRGYGRKTKGYILSDTQSTSHEIGDEPLQFKKKFSGLRVAVDEKRVHGIKKLLTEFPSLQVILLDDAFQHRAVKPGLNIVITDYSRPYLTDHPIPSGGLREFKSGIKRADIIIISKCPDILLPIERKRLLEAINPLSHQKIYFSYIKYKDFIPLTCDSTNLISKEFYFDRNYTVLLLTGIANTKALEYFLNKVKNIIPLKYSDHHYFTNSDIENIEKTYLSINAPNKIIVTTEKDAMRLKSITSSAIKKLPIFYLPIEIDFHNSDKKEFDKQILNYVRRNK